MKNVESWPAYCSPETIKQKLRYSAASPSGLVYIDRSDQITGQNKPAGQCSRQHGWRIKIGGQNIACSDLVLMLNRQFPDEGEVSWHKDGDRYNNKIYNLEWIPGNKETSKLIQTYGQGVDPAWLYKGEHENIQYIREWLRADGGSRTGVAWAKSRERGVRKQGNPAGKLCDMGLYHLRIDGKQYYCHRLVLWLSGQDPKKGQAAKHYNGNVLDNRVDNLYWAYHDKEWLGRDVRPCPGFKFAYCDGQRFQGVYKTSSSDASATSNLVYVGTFDTAAQAEKHSNIHLRLSSLAADDP
jgi:hypothetical protein